MATSGETSDKMCELPCFLCVRKSRNSEAEKYCMDCEEYMCAACVDCHNNFPAMAKHSLIGKSQFGTPGSGGQETFPFMPTARCSIHPTKILDMYCENHEVVACLVCVTVNHGLCNKKHYIPEYVKTTANLNIKQKSEKDLENATERLREVQKRRLQAKNDLEKEKSKYLQDIKDFRLEINKVMDILEEISVKDVENEYETMKAFLEEDTKHTDDLLKDIEDCNDRTKTSGENVAQQFVNSKIEESLMKQTDTLCSSEIRQQTIVFTANLEITAFLRSTEFLKKVIKKNAHLNKVVNHETYNVKLSDDTFDCSIWSVCMLDSGNILMADYINQRIKMVDGKTYSVTDSLKMPSRPKSVCRISRSEAAVSLYNRCIQLVKVDNKLRATSILELEHDCRGIADSGRELYVAEESTIYVYEYPLTRNRQRKSLRNEKNILTCIREMCSSYNRRGIHVADGYEGLVTIDKEGKLLWRYSEPPLEDVWGVCVDNDGNIFVSGHRSGNVVQISKSKKYLGEVVPRSMGLSRPQGLCFDRIRRKLIVAVSRSNTIHVFELR